MRVRVQRRDFIFPESPIAQSMQDDHAEHVETLTVLLGVSSAEADAGLGQESATNK
jgi:hypothetical protein